ncbi:MAG: hypothetical protein FWD48_10060 [Oscillospiraceae bacterium]|nr:hypothetical protein [Oscillospiraceae bacterium]
MNEVNKILYEVCTLQTEDGASFTGYFYKPKKNIWANLRPENNQAMELLRKEHLILPILCGRVNGKDVTVLNAHICSNLWHSDGTCKILLFLDILIIGAATYEGIETKHIYTSIPALKWFGLKSKLESMTNSSNMYIHDYELGINFKRKIKVSAALKKLFTFRQLLCLFADYGVNFNETFYIKFGEIKDVFGVIRTDKSGKPLINNSVVFLNDIEYFNQTADVPFRICYEAVEGNFQEIYNKWLDFKFKNEPLIEVYFEILANKSTKINRFLDLTRIIESYSRKNRPKEVMKVSRRYNQKCKNKCKSCEKCGQYYRYIEMFTAYGRFLPNNGNANLPKVKKLCHEITLLRNHYTHYGEPQGKNTKKDKLLLNKLLKQPLIYGYFSNILHLLVLAAIYQAIGLPDEIIGAALYGGENGRFGFEPVKYFDGLSDDGFPR